ncbi:TonB-dependent receptor [Gemmatimonadetes bacterium T265]|nr:TonB-dependent receptor [Gemmatimonadetes bacterium T265]
MQVLGRVDDLIGTASSASEGRVGAADLRARPITREGELLETVPGLIVTQHSGEGKANQYFVRGFNLDHGTDFQTRVDGVPVNMPTHAHGQGYTDLNFLIPELVDHLDYELGVSHAAVGDFGSAGAAEFHLRRSLDQPFATAASGANGLARLAAGASSALGGGTLLLGGEAKTYDGPWVRAERIRKLSGVARYTWGTAASQFSVTGMAYHNRWNSNDQVPERAVADAAISPYGQIDSTDGGRTERYSLSGEWRHVGRASVQTVQVYGVRSALTLFSDFTYFLDDPVHGDQFSQTERRTVLGANASDVRVLDAFGVPHRLTLGVQTRADLIDGLGLYRTVAQRIVGTIRDDRVCETGSGAYAEAESRWAPWFRTVLGVRADAYTFDVRSDLAANSGARTAAIASPKASLIFTPSRVAELYVSGGFGFHSNDARGTVIRVDPSSGDSVSRVDPLVRSRGVEAGVRATTAGGLRSTVSLWALNLDSELLFTGDAGTTEPSSASRRVGVTFANFYRPVRALALDADVSFARARFHNADATVTHVPGALEHVVAGGATWNAGGPGAFGALRVRHFGAYALVEDNSVRARAATLLNGDVGYQLARGTRVQLSVLNLANARADDIQYYYTSRLAGEPAGGVDDVHAHPVEPRQLRVSLGRGF